MLKVNKTLAVLDLSDNEIGAYAKNNNGRAPWIPSPEGPAALADGLKANQSVQQLDVSGNKLGRKGGKAIAQAKPQQLQNLDTHDSDSDSEEEYDSDSEEEY